jgi:hypothetical protein
MRRGFRGFWLEDKVVLVGSETVFSAIMIILMNIMVIYK